MIPIDDRLLAMALIAEAVCNGAREALACDILEITARTLRRWKEKERQYITLEDGRIQAGANRIPANKLSDEEREAIIDICNQPEFSSLPPSQIIPILADRGCYMASVSTFYRVLHELSMMAERGASRARRKVKKPDFYKATEPNQVWSWDITYIRSSVKGLYFYLYLIEDIFSRKIVGWEIHDEESAEHASLLISKAGIAEGIKREQLVLHSDNGSPMKGSTMKARLEDLGIIASFSRPSTSNDNPYSESLFKTLKYCPKYPNKPFNTIEAAREWVYSFVNWYNDTHRHSGIKFVTPNQRHNGEDIELLQKRTELYIKAKAKHPERWSGKIRDWSYISEVYLNPVKEDAIRKDAEQNKELQKAA